MNQMDHRIGLTVEVGNPQRKLSNERATWSAPLNSLLSHMVSLHLVRVASTLCMLYKRNIAEQDPKVRVTVSVL